MYLSVNNRADVIKIPVIPAEYPISKPQTADKFETVGGEELTLIGPAALKSITIESFFPIRDYPFLRNRAMWGWEYVYKIDTWIIQKLPIRLIITTPSPMNMVVRVSDFSYKIKRDGDLWYSLTLEQISLLGQENYEAAMADLEQERSEEEDMASIADLEARVASLEGIVRELGNPKMYNTVDECPDWARDAVQAALDAEAVGRGGLNLTYSEMRMIVVMYNAGVFA